MRIRFGLLALTFLSGAACYQRPSVPRDKPLSCEATDAAGECPSNMVCVAKVCANTSCETDNDCPVGLTCGHDGCGLPGASGDAGGLFSDGGIQIPPGFDGGGVPLLPGTNEPPGNQPPLTLDGAAPGANPPIGGGGDAGSPSTSFDGGTP